MEKGSLLGGKHPLIEKKTKVLKEIAEAKIIYKAFQTGDGMPPHTNPTDVFVTILSGKMDITVEGEKNNFETGDFVYFPANAVHELLCIEESKILIIK
jgi:quercetin dioxygenase-like cupin family protein